MTRSHDMTRSRSHDSRIKAGVSKRKTPHVTQRRDRKASELTNDKDRAVHISKTHLIVIHISSCPPPSLSAFLRRGTMPDPHLPLVHLSPMSGPRLCTRILRICFNRTCPRRLLLAYASPSPPPLTSVPVPDVLGYVPHPSNPYLSPTEAPHICTHAVTHRHAHAPNLSHLH